MRVKKEDIEKAYAVELEDMTWKPIYPNNIKGNGVAGYYCLMLHKDENGKVSGRKYCIIFQHEEEEIGTGLINPNKIEQYILFEKSYRKIEGHLDYPKPIEYGEPNDIWNRDGNTLCSLDMNDYGSFVYAYKNIEDAKKRALNQYKAIYGYVLSYFIGDDKNEKE